MRILPPAPDPAGGGQAPTGEEAARSTLGVVRGGLESAEGLLIARYFMFSQVYFHPTRIIYDTHLKDFLQLWLVDHGGRFPADPEGHLQYTDNEVMAAIGAAAPPRWGQCKPSLRTTPALARQAEGRRPTGARVGYKTGT